MSKGDKHLCFVSLCLIRDSMLNGTENTSSQQTFGCDESCCVAWKSDLFKRDFDSNRDVFTRVAMWQRHREQSNQRARTAGVLDPSPHQTGWRKTLRAVPLRGGKAHIGSHKTPI